MVMPLIKTFYLLSGFTVDDRHVSIHKDEPEIPLDLTDATIIPFKTTLDYEDFALDRKPPMFKSKADWESFVNRVVRECRESKAS